MREGNCVAIGWPDLGDLSWIEYKQESKDKLRQLLEEKYPGVPSAVGRARNQAFSFVTRITNGDVVLAADGATVIGIGRVNGDYVYDSSSDFPHHRPMEWLSLDEWKMREPEGLQTTVHELRRHPCNIVEAERHIQARPSGGVLLSKTGAGAVMPRLTGILGRIQSVLERKAQVILYGPPGTGKTYWAEKAACELAAYTAFGKPFDELSDQEKQTIVGTDEAKGTVRICCFHPAYGYEDFIEGYRPETVSGRVVFNLQSGVFKQVCKDAESDPNRRFYLVVDEINRGDIPRIFGELLTVLEKDKRGKAIVLPISRKVFRVPQNVFLIGTMNTADRSISLLDTALRRRFGFVELMPDSTVLRDHAISGIPLGPWFEALNRRICEYVGRDARNLQIGHSYLLQGGRPVKDFSAFKRALRDDIIPLLEEYCYEDFSALQNILGNALVDVEKQCIRHELFDEGHEENLVQALLEPCPGISTSAEALASDEGIEEEMPDDEEAEADDE